MSENVGFAAYVFKSGSIYYHSAILSQVSTIYLKKLPPTKLEAF